MDYVPGSGSADDAATAAGVGQWRSKKAVEDYERAMTQVVDPGWNMRE
jgi:hypothetical protein